MGQYSVFDSRDVSGVFRKSYETTMDNSWASKLAMRIETDKETEVYRWLGSAPPLREWLGYRLYQAIGRYTMSITNSKYEASMRFDLDDLRRTLKAGGDQIGSVIVEMAAKAAAHPEVLLNTLITNGDTTTSGLAYDGQQFFDTDHSEGASGTQTNDLTATEIPGANVTTTTAPTASEWAVIILQCAGYMMGFVDDFGDPINGGARAFGVMVGTSSLYGGLVQAIYSNRLSAGVDNPLVGMTSAGISFLPIFNPRRSAATSEFDFFRLDGNTRPFVHQVEVPLMTQMVGAGSSIEFEEDAHLFGVKVVEGAGFGQWQSALEVTLS